MFDRILFHPCSWISRFSSISDEKTQVFITVVVLSSLRTQRNFVAEIRDLAVTVAAACCRLE